MKSIQATKIKPCEKNVLKELGKMDDLFYRSSWYATFFAICLFRRPQSPNQDAETKLVMLCYASPYFPAFIKLKGLSGLHGQTSVELSTCPLKQFNVLPLESLKGATGKSTNTAAALQRFFRPRLHQMEPGGDYLHLTQVFIKLPLWSLLHDER